MNIQTVKKLLMQSIQSGIKATYLLLGDTGIGKTSVVKQMAKNVKMPLVELNLAHMSKEDFLGIMRPAEGRTVWLKPEWILDKPFILLLDEFNRTTDPEVLATAAKLIEEHRVHTHELPQGTHIILTGNPPGEIYDSEEIDPAWLRRITPINLNFEFEPFMAYIKAQKWDKNLIGFLIENNSLCWQPPTVETINTPRPNPAAWEKVNEKMQIISDFSDDEKFEILSADIGAEASAMLLNYLKKHNKGINALEFYNNIDSFITQIRQNEDNPEMIGVVFDDILYRIEKKEDIFKKNISIFLTNKGIYESLKILFLKKILTNETAADAVSDIDGIVDLIEKIAE